MRNDSDNIFRESQNRSLMPNNFSSENPAFYEVMLGNMVLRGRLLMAI
jgi:hypothetical protein